jgi:putative monooxygenase
MMDFKIVVHEDEREGEPDICGEAIELLNPQTSGSKKISMATILINPGKESIKHFHKEMEEMYYIIDGKGEVVIDGVEYEVKKGCAILLPIGSKHQVKNTGKSILKFISVDSPPFDEEDVFMET